MKYLAKHLRVALSIALLTGFVVAAEPVFAKKKDAPDAAAAADAAKAKEEAEIKKTLDPLVKNLDDLMRKYDSRLIFSPADAGKLSDVKYKLMDLISQYPTNPVLAKPVYQSGFLLAGRGEYDDAYELLTFVSTQHAQTPYGQKSRARLYQLQKQLGSDYFQSLQAANSSSTDGAAKDATGKGSAIPAKK